MMYMDEKFNISEMATGGLAVAIFIIVTTNLNTWGFTDAEVLQTVLISGFMALWGINQFAKNLENLLYQAGSYLLAKYPSITEKIRSL